MDLLACYFMSIWFMHYILQRIVTRYARKNVERQEKRKLNVLQSKNFNKKL